MARYLTEELLEYVVAACGAISETRGDSFTPAICTKRSREPDEGHQELPSISCWLGGTAGAREGAVVAEQIQVTVQVMVDDGQDDLPIEDAVNRARADVLAAFFRDSPEQVDEAFADATIVGVASDFLWDLDPATSDAGVRVVLQFQTTRSVGDWRTPMV